MIENFVKASTCKVDCGNELGTGFLVSESMVLTARHCVCSGKVILATH